MVPRVDYGGVTRISRRSVFRVLVCEALETRNSAQTESTL